MSELAERIMADFPPRQAGHSTALVDGARRAGAVMLCHNQQWADEVRRYHGIEALPLSRLDSLRGKRVPVVVDLPVVWELALESTRRQSEVDRMRDIAEALEGTAQHWIGRAAELRAAVELLRAENRQLKQPWWQR